MEQCHPRLLTTREKSSLPRPAASWNTGQVMSRSDPARSLGGFLRARREEGAQLAAISHDYYARLEQRRIAPSPAVPNTLCDVLRLDGQQRAYLYQLAGKPHISPCPRTPAMREKHWVAVLFWPRAQSRADRGR